MEICDINLAIQTLHQKLKLKDIQEFENTRTSIKHDGTESNDVQRKVISEKCANCKYSTKPETSQLHKILNCREIDFCFRCNAKHLALGPHCKFKDTKVFNFENYLKKKKDEVSTKVPQKESNVTTEVTKAMEPNDLSLQILQEIEVIK